MRHIHTALFVKGGEKVRCQGDLPDGYYPQHSGAFLLLMLGQNPRWKVLLEQDCGEENFDEELYYEQKANILWFGPGQGMNPVIDITDAGPSQVTSSIPYEELPSVFYDSSGQLWLNAPVGRIGYLRKPNSGELYYVV